MSTILKTTLAALMVAFSVSCNASDTPPDVTHGQCTSIVNKDDHIIVTHCADGTAIIADSLNKIVLTCMMRGNQNYCTAHPLKGG